MGCSSSKPGNSRDIVSRDTGALGFVPKTNNKADQARYRNETGAGGTIATGKHDEQTVLKRSLILKRKETSMEGRHNQSLVQNLVHDEFRRQITEVYDLRSGTLLGKGGFGTVQTVIHKQSGKKFALKAVELSRVKDEKSLDFFFREVEVMRKLDHPNICRLHAVYPTVEHLFLVMDFCEGGDLLTTYHFRSEQDAAEIVSKVTNAVRYMHDRNIAHRDLKLDNILKYNADDGPDVKLVDFGLSAHFEDFRLEHDVVGTWVYMAPEVISGAHFPRTCDMWSIGVIAYLLLCGYPPFGGSSTAELKEQIQHGTYQFHHDAWSSISAKAKNFIKRLLVRNPQERMSAAEAQHHPWLNPNTPKGEYKLSNEALSNLVSFRNTNYLKKLALELVARSLDSQQIRDLEKDFAKMDKDGSGTISLEEFESVLAGQANLSQGDIHALFESVDVDNAKEINFNEFLAATLGKRALDERRLRLAFDRLDFDHSGTIDAKDLKMIVGCDLGDEVIETIFSEFDENSDGLIDFEEFKVAMRKADAPEVKLARFRTFKSNSLPHRTISNTIKELECTIHENGLPRELGLQAITYSESDDPSLETSDREAAVIRASLVRCASKLIETGQCRRSTVAVSDPAAQRALRDVINHINGATSTPQRSGLDPLPELKIKSDQTKEATSRSSRIKRANIGDLEALPANWDEEPSPWGSRAVTAASIEVKQLQ